MALTETTPMELGYKAPFFSLPDVISGDLISPQDVPSRKGLVVMFICNHCPYVIHVREELVRLANDYRSKGIGFIAISSNDVENYPEDSPEKMKELAMELNFPFPYLYDESQRVAKAYKAACTPDFSVFDSQLTCVYRGRLDGSTPGNNIPVSGTDLRNALDALIQGKELDQPQLPSMGCGIKWKTESLD
ncbi:MAG: thioredoxin family protein [Salibacteraceae bacterium]